MQVAERQIEKANRLLYEHEPSPQEIATLQKLQPLGHHKSCPLPSEGFVNTAHRRCWIFLLQPLRYWPSDLIRVYGPFLLHHPLIIRAIQQLSQMARDPRLLQNSDPVLMYGSRTIPIPDGLKTLPEEGRIAHLASSRGKQDLLLRGWSLISSMDASWQEVALEDETSDPVRSKEAKDELRDIFRALANPAGRVTAKRHQHLRILLEFDRRRAKGTPEKEAVADMTREGWGSSVAAIRSAIEKARKQIGKKTYPPHRRGRFRERPKKN